MRKNYVMRAVTRFLNQPIANRLLDAITVPLIRQPYDKALTNFIRQVAADNKIQPSELDALPSDTTLSDEAAELFERLKRVRAGVINIFKP